VTVPEAGQKISATKLNSFVSAVAKLVLLAITVLALSGVQLVVLLFWGGPVSYAIIAGSIMAAILFAWALGLWQASWFVRIIAAFICVVVTSWPVAALVVFSACYFGPCRLP
jgi:hypothetical protein